MPIFVILFGTQGTRKSSVFEAYREHYLKDAGEFARNDTDVNLIKKDATRASLFLKSTDYARVERFRQLQDLMEKDNNVVTEITHARALRSILPTFVKTRYQVHIVCPYVGNIDKLVTNIVGGVIELIHMFNDSIVRISIINNNDDAIHANANLKKRLIFSYDAHLKECRVQPDQETTEQFNPLLNLLHGVK